MGTTRLNRLRFTALWQTIQPLQRQFIRRALLSMLVWFGVDFCLPLDPPLTTFIVKTSQWMTGFFLSVAPQVTQKTMPFEGFTMHDTTTTMNIAHSCNGKAILFLFTAFLWAMPRQPWTKRLTYSLVGFITLSMANSIRIAALFLISKNLPHWFGFFHHTLFQLAMYALMFMLWMLYLRKQTPLSH